MNSGDLIASVAVLLALQFTAFGWRINREVQMEDAQRRTWFPLPDYLNVGSMLAVLACVVVPVLAAQTATRLARTVLSICFVLIAFHPISMAAHYRLFSKAGRTIYIERGKDYPWITGQEVASVVISILCSCAAAYFTWTRSGA
jgi:hypothetical protein